MLASIRSTVGGNLTIGGGYNVAIHSAGSYTVGSDPVPSSLVIGGNVNWAGSAANGLIKVLSGYVKIGDLSGSAVHTTDNNNASINTTVTQSSAAYNATPGITLTVREPASAVGPGGIDFAGAFTTFRARAQQLAACDNNVTLLDGNGNPLSSGAIPSNGQVKIALAAGQTNVLTISASDLSQIKVLTFLSQPAQDTPLVINVTGTGSFDWTSPNMAGVSGNQAPYILWNLPGFTTLVRTGGDSLEGTLYAPDADFTDNGATNIEGDIIVKTLRQDVGLSNPTTSEYHYFPFNADLSCGSPGPTPTPTPTISPMGSPTPTPTPTVTASMTPTSGPSPTPGPQPSPSSTSTTPGQLPVTGSDLLVLLAGAVAAIGLGLSTLLLRTRRRL
ncbi:MAG TPA: choice-of-anchor A family protein [Streptosporangiaceae bacterium]|nr:choice-of-anchor A family protein [Streptosporangiaceae bacterium]